MMYGTACRAHWSDWLYEVDVEMNIVFVMFKHFDDLKVWQIKQFGDSLKLHRISPLCLGFVGKQTLTKMVKSGALYFIIGLRILVVFQLFYE